MNVFELYIRPAKDRLGKATFLLQKRDKQMLNVDLLVPPVGCQRLGSAETLLQFFRKAVKVHRMSAS